MLRISQASNAGTNTTLRLEGDISGRWVEELRGECDRALRNSADDGVLVLDLEGVASMDRRGLALFRELAKRRVVVTNCSPYVAELLKG